MAAPKASVIVSTYNQAPFVRAAVDSVLAQTLSDLELIVLDDGSTDGTLERLRDYADPRLRTVAQENQGAPKAANAGLRLASGAFVAVLDGDDVWLPTKLERHLDYMERHPHVDLTFSWCGVIDAAGRRTRLRFKRWSGPISFRELLTDYVIGTNSSAVLRRAAVERVGGYDPALCRCYDMDLALRIALGGPEAAWAIEEELTLYRRHPVQMSRDWRPVAEDWERMIRKLGALAPQEVADAEDAARDNMQRYFAFLAYESREYGECAALLNGALRKAPGRFARDQRNWQLAAACASGLGLPPRVHAWLERAAGLARHDG
jgi:glycosyltransferase involved in cell wall biosynthesis